MKFYASLGNHDDRAQSRYKLFNMEGRTYYTFKAPKQSVRFFALETDYLTPPQVAWIEKELVELRRRLEDPLLPPSALFFGREPRVASRPGRRARAAVPEGRRERGVRRSRSLLRARQAAEGHRLFRDRIGREAPQGQHRPEDRPDRRRASTPTRRSWPPRSTATSSTSMRSPGSARSSTPASSSGGSSE